MKSNRILLGAVLTAGLGLTGVVAASSSGATTPNSSDAAPSTAAASVTSVVSGKAGDGRVLTRTGKPGDGPVVVCAVVRAPGGKPNKPGKPGKPGAALPLPEPGKGLPLPKPGQKPVKITVKVVNGKVYVNGKLVPGAKANGDCPALPPLPGGGKGTAAGKGGGVILRGGQGGVSVQGVPGGHEAGLTTSTLRG